jgi:hypothetical protein
MRILTSLPFHLLVTEKPAKAIPQLKNIGFYRDAALFVKRQAVSVLTGFRFMGHRFHDVHNKSALPPIAKR